MRTIVLNSSNLVDDGQNNKLVYNFPSSVLFENTYVAVSSASLYYSWFNIREAYGNNTISYTWITSPQIPAYTLTIPDGLYEVSALNQFLQYEMIKRGHYVIDSAGNNVFFIELTVNPARYAVQVNTYMVDTAVIGTTISGSVKYKKPPGWDETTNDTEFNPILTIPSQLGKLLGFKGGLNTYANFGNPNDTAYIGGTHLADGTTDFTPTSNISKIQSLGTISVVSNASPDIQPNSSVLITCSSVDNPYASPSSVIYTITPNVGAGEIINEKPPAFMWNKLIGGTYNQIRIGLLGNDLTPLQLKDPAMTFVLAFAEEREVMSAR
jgi:hypothetical protein